VAGHAAATFSAHLWILVGRPFGVGHRFDHFGDAGPSVAVVALIAYIAVVRGAGWLALTLVTYHSVEIAVFNGLSQREHLLGAMVGAGWGTAAVAVAARGRAPRRAPVPRVPADLDDVLDDAGVAEIRVGAGVS
jgi:hypothetical protein